MDNDQQEVFAESLVAVFMVATAVACAYLAPRQPIALIHNPYRVTESVMDLCRQPATDFFQISKSVPVVRAPHGFPVTVKIMGITSTGMYERSATMYA